MSKKIPAFPVTLPNGQAYGDHQEFDGMTLRDYFAAKAMQSIIRGAPNGTTFGEDCDVVNGQYASAAYFIADAMLEARK